MSTSTTLLTFANGQVTLGGELLPGIFRDVSVRCDIRFDEAEEDARSGSTKTPLGWNDSDIDLSLDLLTDDDSTCYKKLRSLNSIFKGYDSNGNPKVYTVASSHVSARGITKIVFSGLSSRESDRDDMISCRLSFQEYKPAVVKVESKKTSSSTPSTSTASDPDLSSNLQDGEDPA